MHHAATQPQPNPQPALPGERDLFCAHYDDCLDVAVRQAWPGFACSSCALVGTAQEEQRGFILARATMPAERRAPSEKTLERRRRQEREDAKALRAAPAIPPGCPTGRCIECRRELPLDELERGYCERHRWRLRPEPPEHLAGFDPTPPASGVPSRRAPPTWREPTPSPPEAPMETETAAVNRAGAAVVAELLGQPATTAPKPRRKAVPASSRPPSRLEQLAAAARRVEEARAELAEAQRQLAELVAAADSELAAARALLPAEVASEPRPPAKAAKKPRPPRKPAAAAKPGTLQARILEALGRGGRWAADDLMAELRVDDVHTVRARLSKMLAAGLITRPARGRFEAA